MDALKRGLIVAVLSLGMASAPSQAAIIDVPVTFQVKNQNHSLVPCPAGTGTVTIAGRLVAPDPLPANATLYVHGLSFAQWFWHFDAVPGLDYATTLAGAGHASVIIDRLGYGESSRPDGNQSCLGAQADIVDQILKQLRSGVAYETDGGPQTAKFSRLALAGHSAGGAIVQIAAYSFPKDFDALLVMSYTDMGPSPDTALAFVQAGVACLTGRAPQHYVNFGETDADLDHLFFNTPRPLTGQLPLIDKGPTATPEVIAAANTLRTKNPCGDITSFPNEIIVSQLLLSLVKVPTLLVCGENDAIFPLPMCQLQRLHFLTNTDFQQLTVPGAGHALTIGTGAAEFRDRVAGWLAARGF